MTEPTATPYEPTQVEVTFLLALYEEAEGDAGRHISIDPVARRAGLDSDAGVTLSKNLAGMEVEPGITWVTLFSDDDRVIAQTGGHVALSRPGRDWCKAELARRAAVPKPHWEPPRQPLSSVKLAGFLSFGPVSEAVPLSPLNVIIGPNGSGKSNLIKGLALLREAARDLRAVTRGASDWIWKPLATGATTGGTGGVAESRTGFPAEPLASVASATLELVLAPGAVTWTGSEHDPAVRYYLALGADAGALALANERVENVEARGGAKPYFYFGYEEGRPMVNAAEAGSRGLRRASIDPNQSVLSQLQDPDAYPELRRLGDFLKGIRLYRDWQIGPAAVVRTACASDGPKRPLSEHCDNLPAVLLTLKPAVGHRIAELLTELSPGFDDFEVLPEANFLALYLREGDQLISAARLSDGTLRYLCLLAILLDPAPPPLIVIEEPELGLHPDVLPTLRDLMVEASGRTQLIVTTHSTQLVDAMTDHANSVLICEKHGGSTELTRLTQEEVDRWKKHGGLGSLWMQGHLGGKRW